MRSSLLPALILLLCTACVRVGAEVRSNDDVDEAAATWTRLDGFSDFTIGQKLTAGADWNCVAHGLDTYVCTNRLVPRIHANVTVEGKTGAIQTVGVVLPRPDSFRHDEACLRYLRLADLLKVRLGAPTATDAELCSHPDPAEPNIGYGTCSGWRRGETQVAVSIGRSMHALHEFLLWFEVDSVHSLVPMCASMLAAPSGSQ